MPSEVSSGAEVNAHGGAIEGAEVVEIPDPHVAVRIILAKIRTRLPLQAATSPSLIKRVPDIKTGLQIPVAVAIGPKVGGRPTAQIP